MLKKSKNILFIFFVIILVNLLNRGPDILKAIQQPLDKWYLGQTSWFDPWDLNLYFSIIGWGKRNGILFENLYDTESSQGAPIYFFYTLLGKIASPFNLTNVFTFHLAGMITSFFLGIVVWWFIKIFLEKKAERKIAFALLFLGGGLGWLFITNPISADINQPGFTLANAIRRPHEAISLSLFLLSLGGFWQGVINQKKKALFNTGLASFLMVFFHPYNFFILGTILFCFGFYWWLKRGSAGFLKLLLLLGLEAGIYYFLVARYLLANPSFSGLVSQIQSSPSFFQTILGWGLLFPFMIVAIFSMTKNKQILLMKIWFISHWLITYLPFGFQRSMARGLWIPAIILAVKGTRQICRKINWDYRPIVGLLLIFSSFSTFFMTLARITESPDNRWVYLTQQEGEVIGYLKNHGDDEEGVLASYRIANLIPAHTTKRVWAGHQFQTPQFKERMVKVAHFFAGEMEESEVKSFLKKTKTVWIFWGPEEKAISDLTTFPYQNLMEPVIENNLVSLYKVRQ